MSVVLRCAATVQRVVDGDTLRVHLTQDPVVVSFEWGMTFHTINPDGVSVRLVTVDTPERGQVGYRQAAADLAGWVQTHRELGTGLRCDLYESAGWDRLLADLYDPTTGESASEYMLAAGWPPYRP